MVLLDFEFLNLFHLGVVCPIFKKSQSFSVVIIVRYQNVRTSYAIWLLQNDNFGIL